jgi:signal transduction histidine kinase
MGVEAGVRGPETQALAGLERPAPRMSLYRTLRFRLILSVALVHVCLMGAFTWESVQEQSQSVREQLYNRGVSLSNLMVVASTNAVLAEDLAALAEVTERVRQQPDVRYGEIVDARGQVLASTEARRIGRPAGAMVAASERFPLSGGDQLLDLREEVMVAGRRVGTVLLGLSTESLDAALRSTRNEGLLFILLALFIGSVAAWGLSLALTRHLHELTRAAGKISAGDFSVRVAPGARDESGVLARAFNAMAVSLERTARRARQEHEKRTEAERLACVGELSASIAHEIRNPLAAIINSVSLLDREDLEREDRGEVVDIINSETRRLQRTLNDFLDFARIREPQLTVVDLCPLVEEVARLVERDPQSQGRVRFRLRFLDGSCRARIDADQMRQVLWNLMLNAVQAMSGDGEVTVRVECGDGRVQVSVVDAGCGMEEAFVGKVTKPFVTGRRSGTGLGLAIAQRVLMQHGSGLTIVSQPGVGTEVGFELNAVGAE